MNSGQFEDRKKEHIRLALDPVHQADGSGLETLELIHEALPDLDFDRLHLKTTSLGVSRSTPFLVSGMTAGHPEARALNLKMARVASERGWAMGLGSLRRDLEDPETAVDQWREFQRHVPELELYANLGISQLIVSKGDQIRRLVELVHARGIFIHLNALQEVIQPEGTPRFSGGLQAIEKLVRSLSGIPVLVKETGCGFSKATLQRLIETGVVAVDVSGRGGTHWGRIEGARTPEGSLHQSVSRTFRSWGQSTVESVRAGLEVFQKENSKIEVWASGGVRTGLDAAKLLALGAQRVAYAQPVLKAALEGEEQLHAWMSQIEYELKVALFCTGMPNVDALRGNQKVCRSQSNS